jgi:F-box protein 21
VLGCLHRTIAVQEWAKQKDGGSASLERALAAFDMFVLNGREGDFNCVSCKNTTDRFEAHSF